MSKPKEKIPVFDIHTASFLESNSISPQLALRGIRVNSGLDPPDEVDTLLRRFQDLVLDYISTFLKILFL